jgi:crotonobetainyl-CoA:carnitine CoA-transferase CaiB-like acyl-CoA transferase
VLARGLQVSRPDGAGRAVPMVANPMRFDGQRPVAERAPPGLDQHGDDLRRQLVEAAATAANDGTAGPTRATPFWPGV